MFKFNVAMSVHRLFCFSGSDSSSGSSEPYLWVIGFKFDGATIRQQFLNLAWEPGAFFSRGSHRNIIDGGVQSGMTIHIPNDVGRWHTSLEPIRIDTFGATEPIPPLPGIIGFAAILMEENNVSAAAAEAGHQALNRFFVSKLQDFVSEDLRIAQLGREAEERAQQLGIPIDRALRDILLQKFDVVRREIEGGAQGVVVDAMRNAMNVAEGLWALIDKDRVMGKPVFHMVSADEMLAGEFHHEWTDMLAGNTGTDDGGEPSNRGDYAYHLYSGLYARLRRRQLESQLPGSHDVRIDGIETRYSRDRQSHYISMVGGVENGVSWWLERSEACEMIFRGERGFHTHPPAGTRTKVIAERGDGIWPYLTTVADDSTANNLRPLPLLWTVPGFRRSVVEPSG